MNEMNAKQFWDLWQANFPMPDTADVGEVWLEWVFSTNDDVVKRAIDILAEGKERFPKLAQLKRAAVQAKKELTKPPPVSREPCGFCENVGKVETVWLKDPAAGRDTLLHKTDERIYDLNTRTSMIPCRCSLGQRLVWRMNHRAQQPGGSPALVSLENHPIIWERCALSAAETRKRETIMNDRRRAANGEPELKGLQHRMREQLNIGEISSDGIDVNELTKVI